MAKTKPEQAKSAKIKPQKVKSPKAKSPKVKAKKAGSAKAEAVAAPAVTLESNLFLVVTFKFDKKWNIAPEGRLSGFPPGTGLGGQNIELGPIDVTGLSDAEIVALATKRLHDMALVTKAIAVATTQFADALPKS